MADPADHLTIQFLEWVASGRRTYADAMEAWRSSCPRLTIWEDALTDGLVRTERDGSSGEAVVTLTRAGRARLDGARAADG
ncbi:MAG: hypothetical protein ACM3JJ_11505 [Hyphomicrobiales bacterium]